jgi:plastocyanin
MKLDLTKLPVGEAVVGFFLMVLVVTFVLAYTQVKSEEDEAVEAPTAEPTDDGDGSPAPGDGEIAMVMGDNFFDPEEVSVPAGTTVTFNLVNEGRATHNMHIQGENGEYDQDFCDPTGEDPCSDPNTVGGGQEATLEWQVPDTPGELEYRCDFHPVEMVGTVTIE